jgi:predicted kinase
MVELLVGPVGSGKSTYSREKAKDGAIIINDDDIVKLIHGGEYGLYEKKLKPLYKLIENQILTTAMLMDRHVIVDRPNFSRDTRSRYISLAKSFDVPISCALWEWTTSEDSAGQRFYNDSRGYSYEYWLNVAKFHYSKYEEPTLDEGFFEIKRII